MEANESHELQEHAEHVAHETTLRPVAFTMSVLAVLVAVTTVLGHRTHTQAVLNQDDRTDQWGEYQAHKTRASNEKLHAELLRTLTVTDKAKAEGLAKKDDAESAKLTDETKDDMEKAEALQKKVEEAEARADRFDLAEALLEIGLVITSVTLLTHRRIYWHFGILFALGGILSAASVLLLK